MTSEDQSKGRVWDHVPATGPLLTPREAAAYIGRERSTYYRLAREGKYPRPISVRGVIGVPRPWLDAIIADAAQ